MTDLTVLGALEGPTTVATDGNPINLANQIGVSAPAWTLALRMWRGSTDVTGVVGHLWRVDGAGAGTLLVSKAYDLSGIGWQETVLDTPIELEAGQPYRVGYSTVVYPYTAAFWTTGDGAAGIANGIVSMPSAAAAVGGDQSAYIPGAAGTFPTESFNGNNYWADLRVTDVDPAGADDQFTWVDGDGVRHAATPRGWWDGTTEHGLAGYTVV